MTAIPTGISEAHEVDARLTCDAPLYTVPEQIVERVTNALRGVKAALLDGDIDGALLAVKAAHRAVGSIEVAAGQCSYEGTVEGFYLDDETAEASCPKCGTIHEVPL